MSADLKMKVDLDGRAQGPLVGIGVADFSSVVSGPFCAQVLGDLGADVTKVETFVGDSTRMMGPPFRDGVSGIFAQFNRNKRSIAIDLKRPQGRAVAQRLAGNADVMLENYRPGVAERLGIGYQAVAERNPGLIYVAINGFGPDGPYASQPAYDTVIQGLSGFMPIQGADGEPQLVRNIIADKTSGLTATYAVMAALFARERGDGRGQKICVPMLDAYAAFILPDAFGPETFLPKEGPGVDFSGVHRTWQTKDGYVVMMIVEDRQFAGLCRVLEREELIDDPRYANLMTRLAHAAELFEEIESELAKRTTEEIVKGARRHGVPLAPANTIEDFLEDPQVAANGTVLEVEHAGGQIRVLRNPVRFESTPTSYRRHPPRRGEHTDQILGEAGYSAEEIAALRSSGSVA